MDSHPAALVSPYGQSPFTSPNKQPAFLPPTNVYHAGRYSPRGPRAISSPALTDWPMVMPSIFRAGTCFMGFRAWNSLENCGDKVLVGRRPGLTSLKQNQASRKTPGPLPTLEPRPLGKALAPRPKVTPGCSVQYPHPQGLLRYRLQPNGLAKCTSHAGHHGKSRGPSMGQGPTHYPPSWGPALRARLRSGAWSLGPSSGSSS